MHFSPNFKSSSQCVPSPDGQLIATLVSPISILIRSTQTLETVTSLKLPPSLGSSIYHLLWSPSSTAILVSTSEQLHVQSITGPSFKATIQNPTSSIGRVAHVLFGPRDTDVLIFSAFGVKLLIYDLSTSQAVEVPSPKFHQSATAARGFSIRPGTEHLALLTRVGGRDAISIHHPTTRQLQRSWNPDASDLHGLLWSPDGNWLVAWESPAYGAKLLLYTADGQLFRTLTRFGRDIVDESAALAPGIKLCRFSLNGSKCIVCEHSRSPTVLDASTWRAEMVLRHPTTIEPRGTLQVWQEQLGGSSSLPSRAFIRATQSISPSGPTATTTTPILANEGAKQGPDLFTPGCSTASFDASSTLLATRLDDSPSTLWIWDLTAAAPELRAVLLFHSRIDFAWHPRTSELLLITCVDEATVAGTGAVTPFTWDPLSEGPVQIPLAEQLSSTGPTKNAQAVWLNTDGTTLVLLSDGKSYCLGALDSAPPAGWQDAGGFYEDDSDVVGDDTSMLEDTFSFKNG